MSDIKDSMIPVGEVIDYLKGKIKIIIILPTILSIVGIFYAQNLPEIFESKGTYEIRENNKSDSSGFLSALSGGNISNILSSGANNSGTVIKILKSKENTIKFLLYTECQNNQYLDKSCESVEEKKEYPSNIIEYRLTKDDLRNFEKKYVIFGNSLGISSSDGLVTISYKSLSGDDAYETLISYINFINSTENYKKNEELNNSIFFAENQLVNANKNFIREAYSRTLESFTYELSMLNMQKEYLLKSIDSPLVPVKKIAPNKTLIVIIFFVGSLGLLMLILIVRFFLKNLTK